MVASSVPTETDLTGGGEGVLAVWEELRRSGKVAERRLWAEDGREGRKRGREKEQSQTGCAGAYRRSDWALGLAAAEGGTEGGISRCGGQLEGEVVDRPNCLRNRFGELQGVGGEGRLFLGDYGREGRVTLVCWAGRENGRAGWATIGLKGSFLASP